MAYLKRLKVTCNSPSCEKAATQQLYNNRNAPIGYFCTTHSKYELKKQQEFERMSKAWERWN